MEMVWSDGIVELVQSFLNVQGIHSLRSTKFNSNHLLNKSC